MTPLRKGVAAVVAVGLTVATAALSRVPVSFSADDQGQLRLSWRVEGVTAEACRPLSAEELARLPVHMRNPKACIGVIASYHLQVTVDGAATVQDTIRPPGARGDRPITVLRELPLAPGPHRVGVRFDALLPEGVPVPEGVASLAWEGAVDVGRGDVVLLTLDDRARALVRRERPGLP